MIRAEIIVVTFNPNLFDDFVVYFIMFVCRVQVPSLIVILFIARNGVDDLNSDSVQPSRYVTTLELKYKHVRQERQGPLCCINLVAHL